MNNGRIWCVVKPTVGLPLFLGGVAVIALAVHASVMSNTSWMADYWQGNKPRRADVQTPAVNVAQAAAEQPYVINVMPVSGMPADAAAFVVTITPRAGAPQSVTLLQRPEAPPGEATGPAPTQ
jgi:light-harvesting protein B-800-850 alpha chain